MSIQGMGKIDISESPYGSWMGLPSGTPPPPNLAPPQPPIVTADGYRSIRDASNIASEYTLFSSLPFPQSLIQICPLVVFVHSLISMEESLQSDRFQLEELKLNLESM